MSTVLNTTGASHRSTRPRSEKNSCSENQIRFSQNHFRFRKNAPWTSICGKELCGNLPNAAPVLSFEFYAIFQQHDNTLAQYLLHANYYYNVCRTNIDRSGHSVRIASQFTIKIGGNLS